VDSFLFVSLFKFQEVNDTKTLSINSTINEVDIKGYNYKLDTYLVPVLVFMKITSAVIEGSIKSIQIGLFKNFKLLKLLFIAPESIGNFVHYIGISWMNDLSIGTSIVFDELRNINYTYPDKDFCLFSQFPLNKSLKLDFMVPQLNCSFTYTWLCKNGRTYRDPCFYQPVNSTYFEARLRHCKVMKNYTNQQQDSNAYSSYTDYYQTRLVGMFFMQMVPFVLIPCACISLVCF
jgi:hypothetical protein